MSDYQRLVLVVELRLMEEVVSLQVHQVFAIDHQQLVLVVELLLMEEAVSLLIHWA